MQRSGCGSYARMPSAATLILTYALMVRTIAIAREHPTLAVPCGSLAGMTLNFILMKKIVFR